MCMHASMYTYMYVYVYVYMYMYMYVYVYMYMYMCMYMYVWVDGGGRDGWMDVGTHAAGHASILACMYTTMHACERFYINLRVW